MLSIIDIEFIEKREVFDLLFKLSYTNPFSKERISLEEELLSIEKKRSRVLHIGDLR